MPLQEKLCADFGSFIKQIHRSQVDISASFGSRSVAVTGGSHTILESRLLQVLNQSSHLVLLK